MIIYNKKKMMQEGGKWYNNDTTTNTVNTLTNTVNQVSNSNRKTYSPNTYSGNMLASNVQKVDPGMKNQGETTAATTGAVSGALEGASASDGSVVGTAAGAVIGGLSSWLGQDSKNKSEYEQAQQEYDNAVAQANANYSRSAQSRYAREYAAYKQDGGQLGVTQQQTYAGNALQSQPTHGVNTSGAAPTVPIPTMTNQTNQMNVTQQGQFTPRFSNGRMFKSGGSFQKKYELLLASSSKKV